MKPGHTNTTQDKATVGFGPSQMGIHLWNYKETEMLPNKWYCVSLQNLTILPIYHLRTERRLRLTGMSTSLPKIFQAWCKRRPWMGVPGLLLHHDNASAHTAAVTLDCLTTNDVQLVTHPLSSPDLAPHDWFLFPSVKWQLKGKQLQKAEDARAFFEGIILGIPQSTWSVS